MTPLVTISITTGILSGIWAWMADSLGLLSWAGFLGCTSYFATKGDVKSLLQSAATNMTGVFWAMVIIGSSTVIDSFLIGYAITGFISFMMCIQAKQKILTYIPGTFIGACATFAGNGDWRTVAASLLLGAVMGFAMKQSGEWLYQKLSIAKSAQAL